MGGERHFICITVFTTTLRRAPWVVHAQHWHLATRSVLASQSDSVCVSRSAGRRILCDCGLPAQNSVTRPRCRASDPGGRRCWRALRIFFGEVGGEGLGSRRAGKPASRSSNVGSGIALPPPPSIPCSSEEARPLLYLTHIHTRPCCRTHADYS